MQIELLSEAQADAVLTQPLEMGLHKHLADHTTKTIEEHHKRIYGCRHCTQRRLATADEPMQDVEAASYSTANLPAVVKPATSDAAKPRHAPETEPKIVLRDFNALRSHVKSK
jgi:hypothetical protein